MFSKKLAGIGAVAALVGSALVPSVAFAAPSDDATNPPDVQSSVQIEKKVVINDQISVVGDAYTFNITQTPCTNGTPATDTACRPVGDYPVLSANSVTATFAAGDTATKTVNFPLPEQSAYTEAGIYVWTVVEAQSGAQTPPHTVDYSKASYRVKAYVVKDEAYVAPGNNEHPTQYYYKAVTIAQDKDDSNANVTLNNKKDKMTFENVYEDVTTFEVTKVVENKAGLPEASSYDFTVEFGWPANFDGTTRTGHTPAVTVGGDATEGNCAASATAKKTTCTFKLAKGKKATFANVPVGASYTVTETPDSSFKYSIKSISSPSGVVPAAGASSTVTNEYDDITPTGVMLAVLPYVLMIGIPLLAIAGYIALRRKMNL